MRSGPAGLHKDLASGRFKVGSNLYNVTAAYKPVVVFEHDGFTTAVYTPFNIPFRMSMSHTYVVARDGKLVYAYGGSCVWNPTFLNSLTKDEQQKYKENYLKAREQYLIRINQRNLLGLAARALAGPAGAVAHPAEE
jgi:hypothetical protein